MWCTRGQLRVSRHAHTDKPSGSSEHSTLWQTNCCCEHTHNCVLQKKSIEGCTQVSRVGRPIAAVSIDMCASDFTCLVQNKSVRALTISKLWQTDCCCEHTHMLKKRSTEGRPTNACCERTHVCCSIAVYPIIKSRGRSEHSTTLANQLLL